MGAWHDRFQTPSVQTLTGDLPADARALADAVAARMGKARPKVAWMGVPWRWAIAYERPGGMVYVVPDPARPLLAARIPTGRFEERPPASLPRPTREAMVTATSVGDGVWVEWTLTGKAAVEGALDLIDPG